MTATLTIRVDNPLKAEAEDFFEDVGMNMKTAITCFFKKCLAAGEIPFRISRQGRHDRLLAALNEAREAANGPTVLADTGTHSDLGL